MTNFAAARRALRAAAAGLIALAPPAFGDEVQEANKLFKAGQPQLALDRVNKALAAKPRDPQARFLKGLILAEQGNSKEATDIFLLLTRDYPELPEPYNNLAVLYAAQGQYDKARAALEQSIRTHPSYATAYENLGDVYAKLASQAYDKALQIDSANPGAKNKLALVKDLVGAAPRAAAAADKAPARPTATGAAQAAAARPVGAEVLEAVNAWAKAWSAKDADAYLSFYAKDFRTPNGEPRSEWEKGRRQRIGAPKSIAVSVESAKVSVSGDAQASVTFRQNYRSDALKVTSTKTLVMAKSEGRWRIQQEKVAR